MIPGFRLPNLLHVSSLPGLLGLRCLPSSRPIFLVLLACVLLFTLPACRQQMSDQPSYRPLSPSSFFRDGRSARPPVFGTIARGQLRDDPLLYQGLGSNGDFSAEFPYSVTDGVLRRGRERYNIFCAVCHGLNGSGDGRIVQRGFTRPPSYHTDLSRGYKLKGKDLSLRDVPVGYVYDVITRGYGAMPALADQIPVRDRWAIVGYLRALQYSQSPEYRQQLEGKKDKTGTTGTSKGGK